MSQLIDSVLTPRHRMAGNDIAYQSWPDNILKTPLDRGILALKPSETIAQSHVQLYGTVAKNAPLF